MPLPANSVLITGGCNCGAIRYKIDIPAEKDRLIHPTSDSSSTVRLPFIAIDHCNDCRRATGSILPLWMCTPESMVTASLIRRSTSSLNSDASKRGAEDEQEARGPWLSACEIFRPGTVSEDSFLTFYESSEGRRRSFCGRCGTNIAYTIFPMLEGWPEMLDVVLGTADRECLENNDLSPERHLWWDCGTEWVQKFSVEGAGKLPIHPVYKINEFVDRK